MRLVVDLNRCQGFAQCVFLAPDVFALHRDEALLFSPRFDEAERDQVEKAAAACPVQALLVDYSDEPTKGVEPSRGDELVVARGTLTEERFVAVYGYRGRVIAAASFDGAKWLGFYEQQIAADAPFPAQYRTVDRRTETLQPVDPAFPDPHLPTHGATVTLTGHSTTERRVEFVPSHA